MNKKIVAANWKMNLDRAGVQALCSDLKGALTPVAGVEVVICPSFVWLDTVVNSLGEKVSVGAQNASSYESGAYTGEVAPMMLKSMGVRYVILGHSERRSLFAETDELIAKKCVLVAQNKLTPILCVGESLEERKNEKSLAVVRSQLDAVIAADKSLFQNMVIAYEPVWAIGTGLSASVEQVAQMHAFIHDHIQEKTGVTPVIQYGGSVKAATAKDLAAVPFVDGFLVGGASLIATEFQAITQAFAS